VGTEPGTVPPHCASMILHMPRFAPAAILLLAMGGVSAQAGVRDGVNRAVGEFNRDLCRTFDLKGCKTNPAKPQARATSNAKPAAKPSAPAATAVKAQPPSEVPVPRQKPRRAATTAETTASVSPPEQDSPAIPIPRAKPIMPQKQESKVAAVTPVLPAPRSVTAPEMPLLEKPIEAQPSASQDCQQRLSQLGLTFQPKPTLASGGACTLTDPVMLSSVSGESGKIVFPDQPILNCAFAETFTKWLKEKGDPSARREAKAGLSVLYTGPGYDCRGRNGDGSAKLSEHGYGNAVDITQFKLTDGRTFQVSDALNPVSPAYATLKSLRFTACERFSTVLGPGANAAHAGHFHFDNGRHGKTGTYRICE
jgi:hypothetical protein